VASARVRIVENDNMNDKRIQARDAATRMLNRMTAGLAFGAIAGVGLLGAVSAYTIPGATTSSSGAVASTSTSSGSTSTGLQSSSTSVGSSSSSGVAVSGGS
jgi:hypothetical protein